MGSTPTIERWHRLVHRQPLFFVAVAAIIGVLLDSRLGGLHRAWGLVWFALFAAALVAIIGGRDRVRRWATILISLPLAALLHFSGDAEYRRARIFEIADAVAQPTILEGMVDVPTVLRRHPLADQPGRRAQSPWQTQIEISLRQVKIKRNFEPVDGRVLVFLDGRRDELRPGDLVRVYGAMQRFASPTNPGERDLRAVYQRRRLHARVHVDSEEQIVLLGEQFGGLNRIIAKIAAGGRDLLLRHTSESTGPLAVALVMGQRDFVDRDTRDLLLVTGTAHLLSVSGLHLAIIVVLASWTATLLGFPSAARICWVISICLLYTAITGGRPPVMRASVLVATFTIAIWMKRPSQPINTLSLAALILVFINPEFVFSIGVQLSFLAVATLVLCGQRDGANSAADEQAIRRLERMESLIDNTRSKTVFCLRYVGHLIGQLTWFSACVTAISVPLVWQQFHVVSPVSVLTNVMLGPFLFLSLAAGVATVLFGSLLDPLAIVPGFICEFSVGKMRWLIESAASIPWGHFWLPAPPAWWVAAFYVVIAATLFLRPSKSASSIRYGWIASWMVIALMLATAAPSLEEGSLEATFIDVGHGTCVVIRFAENDVWLYDCGRLGNDVNSSRDIDVALWSLGVTRLQGVFLSHADADHFNAVPGVLRRFGVGEIVTPRGMLDEPELALETVRLAIKESGIAVRELASGAKLTRSGHAITVLHPPFERLAGSDNANSLVIRIDCGGKTLVLPGDLEPPGTRMLINADRPPPGGILMAPHHGSLQMDAATVLRWSRPGETIVSGGQRARRPEVQQMLSVTGSGVHVTSEVGAIRTRIDSQGNIEVRSWARSPW
jgi:competence protein ComEC